MKVCTDACLFGAWVAANIKKENLQNILDIGAGTGLLSLMLAQNTDAIISAIELNKDASYQAAENFDSSPWTNQLKIYNSDIFEFRPSEKYALIISNPPFFENDLKSEDSNRNAAMHSTTLNLESLLIQIKRLMMVDGKAAVLIPFKRSKYFEQLISKKGFFIEHLLYVKQTVNHDFFRSLYIFSSSEPSSVTKTELIIHDSQKQYTPEFTVLLKEYYLNL